MPYTIEIQPDRLLSVVRLSGYVNADELERAAEEQSKHADFKPNFDSLWDLRDTRAVDLNPEETERLIERKLERDRRLGLSGRIAIVVNRHTVAGAAMLVKVRSSQSPGRVVDVFQTEKQALAWLEAR